MQDLDAVFAKLAESSFRCQFHLGDREYAYFQRQGMTVILAHAAEFIQTRLGSANPVNDGKQTPFRNHPVFVAQHATGTCCRRCLAKWHRIPQGNPLTATDVAYVVRVLERWLQQETIGTPTRAQLNQRQGDAIA